MVQIVVVGMGGTPLRHNFKGISFVACLIFGLLSFGVHTQLQAKQVFVEDALSFPVNLGEGLSYYRDSIGDLSFDEIRQLELENWQQSTESVPSFGYEESAYWFRAEILNSNRVQSLYVEVGYPILDDIQFYLIKNNEHIVFHQMGDNFPFNQRPAFYHNFLLPLSLQPGENVELYLRVKTVSSLQVPLSLWKQDSFYEKQLPYLMGQGVYFGMMAVIVVYNLFIYTVVRQRAYLFYVISVLGVALLISALNGFGFQYVWPKLPWINEWIIVFSLALFGGFACIFTNSFLSLKKNGVYLYHLLSLLSSLYIIYVLITVAYDARLGVRVAIVNGVLACLVGFVAGVVMLMRGVRVARYYVLAYSSLIIASVVVALNKVGYLPRNIFTEHSLQVSSVLEMVLLSFALADRFNEEKRQKAEAQERAIENEKIARTEHERYLQLEYSAKVKELEAERKVLSAEAESKARTEFMAVMSHEIRTPMNGVLGMTDLLYDTAPTPRQLQYLDIINSSGKALLNIINDVLDYSKIVSNKMELESIDFDLYQLVQDCVAIFSHVADQKEIETFCVFSPNTPSSIKGDPTRIRQVLVNLLGNAFKFTDKGIVRLKVSVDVKAELQNESDLLLHFEVQDTGIGIPESAQERLFKSFSQADNTISRHYGGTGLGLSISKKLIELMGGGIGVRSVEGKGSTFYFSICCAKANSKNTSSPELEVNLQGIKLLIVDDSPDYAGEVLVLARQWGMKVDISHNGNESLQMISSADAAGEPYQLVLFDMKMPGLTGLECSKALLSLDLAAPPKSILMTAMKWIPSADVINKAGIAVAGQKPISGRKLKELFDAVVAGREGSSLIEDERQPVALLDGMTILVADDNQVNQIVVKNILQNLFASVVMVEDGEAALELLKSRHDHFDVVLMDCDMPKLNGYEAVEALRQFEKDESLRRLPVIALTAHVLDEFKVKAFESGMDDYITKPFEMRVLANKLVAYRRGESPLPNVVGS